MPSVNTLRSIRRAATRRLLGLKGITRIMQRTHRRHTAPQLDQASLTTKDLTGAATGTLLVAIAGMALALVAVGTVAGSRAGNGVLAVKVEMAVGSIINPTRLSKIVLALNLLQYQPTRLRQTTMLRWKRRRTLSDHQRISRLKIPANQKRPKRIRCPLRAAHLQLVLRGRSSASLSKQHQSQQWQRPNRKSHRNSMRSHHDQGSSKPRNSLETVEKPESPEISETLKALKTLRNLEMQEMLCLAMSPLGRLPLAYHGGIQDSAKSRGHGRSQCHEFAKSRRP